MVGGSCGLGGDEPPANDARALPELADTRGKTRHQGLIETFSDILPPFNLPACFAHLDRLALAASHRQITLARRKGRPSARCLIGDDVQARIRPEKAHLVAREAREIGQATDDSRNRYI